MKIKEANIIQSPVTAAQRITASPSPAAPARQKKTPL